jgi:hypothetical protein
MEYFNNTFVSHMLITESRICFLCLLIFSMPLRNDGNICWHLERESLLLVI